MSPQADGFYLEDPDSFWDGAWGMSNLRLSPKRMKEFTVQLAEELGRVPGTGQAPIARGIEPVR